MTTYPVSIYYACFCFRKVMSSLDDLTKMIGSPNVVLA